MTQPLQNLRSRAVHRGVLLLCLLASAPSVYASTTNGFVDTAHKYAWSTVGGFVNFAPSNSTITITDSSLSGYAWSANSGWINFAPSGSGVTNNGNGTLGGFAWDSSQGWVSFIGVTIDSSGRFHGKAVGANETITFDCANCDVRTDWRPASSRITSSSSSGGGGGSISPVIVSSPSQPQSNPLPSFSSPSETADISSLPHTGELGSIGKTEDAPRAYEQATSGIHANGATVTPRATTGPRTTEVKSFFRAIAVPSGVFLLLVLAFFMFRFFLWKARRRNVK